MKEAYRTNKHILYEVLNKRDEQWIIILIYTGKTSQSFSEINKKIISILNRLKQLNESDK